MERLSDGLAIADISPDVVQGGLVPTMQCGTQGAVSGDSLKLYLVDHNLIEVSRNRCENGTAYRGRVSTLNPTYEHGDFPKIQCAAMQLVMTGAYDVEICAEDGDISAMDIVPRADEPTTPGFTVESLKSTCSNDK